MSTIVYVILSEFPDGLSVDTISELTATAGVTIDGVILKDSGATLAADLAMGGANVSNVGTISGEESAASLILAGFTANAQHDIKIQTPVLPFMVAFSTIWNSL